MDCHGGGGQWNVHFTNKAYLVKLSTKGRGGGGQKTPKNGPHGLCTTPQAKWEMGKLQKRSHLFLVQLANLGFLLSSRHSMQIANMHHNSAVLATETDEL